MENRFRYFFFVAKIQQCRSCDLW